MTIRYLFAALTIVALAACDGPAPGTGSQTGAQATTASQSAAQAEARRQRMAGYYGPRGGAR